MSTSEKFFISYRLHYRQQKSLRTLLHSHTPLSQTSTVRMRVSLNSHQHMSMLLCITNKGSLALMVYIYLFLWESPLQQWKRNYTLESCCFSAITRNIKDCFPLLLHRASIHACFQGNSIEYPICPCIIWTEGPAENGGSMIRVTPPHVLLLYLGWLCLLFLEFLLYTSGMRWSHGNTFQAQYILPHFLYHSC